MQTNFVQGETFTYTIDDDEFASVTLKIGATAHTLTLASGVWSCVVDTSALSGSYRWATFADGAAVESGIIFVRPLVSKYREVLLAIDTALHGVATNGKYSITVGEIHLQDKTFDEMVKARNYYARLADCEENGTAATFGPYRVCEVYGC